MGWPKLSNPLISLLEPANRFRRYWFKCNPSIPPIIRNQLLEELEPVQKELIRKATREKPPWKVTINLDATVIESYKHQAYGTYLGERGYQPAIAYWKGCWCLMG